MIGSDTQRKLWLALKWESSISWIPIDRRIYVDVMDSDSITTHSTDSSAIFYALSKCYEYTYGYQSSTLVACVLNWGLSALILLYSTFRRFLASNSVLDRGPVSMTSSHQNSFISGGGGRWTDNEQHRCSATGASVPAPTNKLQRGLQHLRALPTES